MSQTAGCLNHKIRLSLKSARLCVLLVGMAGLAQAQTEQVLHNFSGGADGSLPEANLIEDAYGNLYGTTNEGGIWGWGTVFMFDPSGIETVLYAFRGGADGANPDAGLVLDASGNLYGTTSFGGTYGHGTVFRVSPLRNETVIHSFTGGRDGGAPMTNLIGDGQGYLYGTTSEGGDNGFGAVFQMTLSGAEKVLYSFTAGRYGAYLPSPSSLIRDKQGNLYGTTEADGAYGSGTVFVVTPNGAESVLYNFTGGSDGGNPLGGLIQDALGYLYGTTELGGAYGNGTVFLLSPSGAEKVLHSFTGGVDGAQPTAGLIQDGKGYLYGTTAVGGAGGAGTVFLMSPKTGIEKVFYSFTGGADGRNPTASLLRDIHGNLYSTTVYGGASGQGTLFLVQP